MMHWRQYPILIPIPTEIKKIVPFDHNSPIANIDPYFKSVFQDEMWIKAKMEQMAA